MLGENLRRMRERRGITQEELAERVHVVRQTVSKWEKGLSVPDADLLMAVAETLQVSVSDLIGVDAVQAKSIEELSVQAAVLNEQIDLQNRRMARTTTIAKRAIAACILAVVLVVGVGVAVWFAVPSSFTQITVEYEIGGEVRQAQINVNDHFGRLSAGYSWPSEDDEIFGQGDLLMASGTGQPDVQLLLHAAEVAVENAGGKVVRISSTTS
ncbi:MAG: helix-turn-helix transcriptional regulator [Adlercreutzia caecimuris]|uniref:helix-turn-helix transcriptional regulator n=1 Tax=Adlercreutzia caecimuris TaxID=671266 RepID=UPI001364D503|nr:helix-turn-helix transcriptional regulator [Adlercreutzia caecimuris]MCI9208007.1 helix-turn-helix transcriptional regulator [Adlercreutzia caecimuris]NBJ67129.1 XRE family transcriptional regulator [Adlercreutzia caecimuris]